MKISLGIIFFLIILSLNSCDNSSILNITNELTKSNSDTLVRDMPYRIRRSGIERDLKTKKEETLGLNSIEFGYSDFILRVWDNQKYPFGYVFIVKYEKPTWKAEVHNYKFISTGSFFADSLSGEKMVLGEPKSGWSCFLSEIIDLGILTLPDFEFIPNYSVAADETSVIVEIAKRNYYRYYEYTEPDLHKDLISSAQKMVNILDLIKKEFSLN